MKTLQIATLGVLGLFFATAAGGSALYTIQKTVDNGLEKLVGSIKDHNLTLDKVAL